MSCPQNPQELQKQIKYYFSQNYSVQQAKQLGESLIKYFKYHQFDEWKDIQDDICNGYEDCCCKEILIQVLKLANIQKKKTEYYVLKRCIEKKLMITSDDADIKRIKNDIIIVFKSLLNQQFANKVLESFTHIIEEQTFDDLESIMDDTAEIEQSEIISYIVEQINGEEYDKNIISEGIHCIIHGKTDELFKMHRNSNKFASYNLDKLPMDGIINNLRKRLLLQSYDESVIDKILSSFRTVITDNFDDLTTVKEDIDEEDATNSQILEYVLREIDSFLNGNDKQTQLNMIIESIKCVTLNEENKENKEIEEKNEENGSKGNADIITKLEASLKERLKIQFDEEKANNTAQLFHKVILEQQYEYADIQEDIQDIENSCILQEICKNEEDSKIVASIIQSIVNNNTFNIKTFEYKLDESCIDEAKKLISKLKEQYGFDDVLLSTQSCLTNAKALELFIGYPILNWLFDLYSVERAKKVKKTNDNNYSVKQWFNENLYTKWIKNKYIDESPKIVEGLIAAMDELVHRAAPNLKVKDVVADVICDSLNDMVQYTLVMHHIAHNITEQMSNEDVQCAPTQIDYAIIPQAIKQRKANSMLDINKDRNILCQHLPDEGDEEEENKYTENEDEYRWHLGKLSDKLECQIPIWDIEAQLQDPRISYIKGKDYFVEEAKDNYHKIYQQMYQMWEHVQHHEGRYKRYIFIVDRRNPKNLEKGQEHQFKMNQTLNVNMRWNTVKFIHPEIDGNKTHKDKIYLIIPKRYQQQEIDRIIQPMCECGIFLMETTMDKLHQNIENIQQRMLFSSMMKRVPLPTDPEQNKYFNKIKNPLKKHNIEREEFKNIKCSNMKCRKIFNDNEKVWHCPSELNTKHFTPIGYNLCNKCAKLNKDNQIDSRSFATYRRIPDEWDKLPEALLGLSKQYILPCIVDRNQSGIGLLDSWAGYKFGFSFHLMSSNNAKTYWYYRGVKKFELTDIKSLWPELFQTTKNGQKQKLTQDVLRFIDEYGRTKQLRNNNFEKFKTQIDEMKNDELCDRYQRLIALTKLCDNILLNVELNEDDNNIIIYNETEKQIQEHIKNSQIMYNEMDLIADEDHVRCCHKIQITNNSKWMSLFRKAIGHNYNIVMCDHHESDLTIECGERYDCPIYKRLTNLVEWMKANQHGIGLKEYIQQNITYSKYDFDADMNHSNKYHISLIQKLISRCGHRYNCKIYNQAWKARKQQSGSYNPTTHKWIAAMSKCHNAFYHS